MLFGSKWSQTVAFRQANNDVHKNNDISWWFSRQIKKKQLFGNIFPEPITKFTISLFGAGAFSPVLEFREVNKLTVLFGNKEQNRKRKFGEINWYILLGQIRPRFGVYSSRAGFNVSHPGFQNTVLGLLLFFKRNNR